MNADIENNSPGTFNIMCQFTQSRIHSKSNSKPIHFGVQSVADLISSGSKTQPCAFDSIICDDIQDNSIHPRHITC